MAEIQQQMIEIEKNKDTILMRGVWGVCKEFAFTAKILMGVLAEGRKHQYWHQD